MRALIIGAGIAGPVAAMALQRAGLDVTIYERRPPAPAWQGSWLTLATNGLDALSAVSASSGVAQVGFVTRRIHIYSGTGRMLGTVPLGRSADPRLESRTMARAELHRLLLHDARSRGIPVEHGRQLVDAEVTAHGVTARFEGGPEARGDVLVGCDGVHSVTRRLIDEAAPTPRYVGLVNFGGSTPGMSYGEPGAWHMVFGRRAFFGYAADGCGGTAWFANVPRPPVSPEERRATSPDAWRARLVELFAGDVGPMAALLSAGHLELAADNTHDLPRVPRWSRGPVVVIGDAAHAPSPSSGQGAALAIEDAVVLAQCLRDRRSVADALATYERLRRRRVERVVAHGARGSSSKAPGPVGRGVRDLLLPVVFRYAVTEASLDWMYSHHLDWERPV